ncbi:MAG: PilZ domain-containing protein [Hyphomicrobiales bacterium]|nr:PilZ domain-containing protein [Hyphomicrobiales bacterium]
MVDKPKRGSIERRDGVRSMVTLRACVSGRDGTAPLDCLIRDAAHHGCRIVSTAINELPDDIRLTIDGVSKPVDGRIVWRKGKQAGVEFCLQASQEIVQRTIDLDSCDTLLLADLPSAREPHKTDA